MFPDPWGGFQKQTVKSWVYKLPTWATIVICLLQFIYLFLQIINIYLFSP